MRRRRFLPIALTTLAALLWGSSFTVVKIGLRYFDPYVFVLLRFAVATTILVGIVAVARKLDEFTKALGDRYVILLGVVLAASFGFQFRGQAETTASKAAMIINSSVVLVAPLSLVLLKEKFGWREIGALLLGLFGVYLITAERSATASSHETLFGNFLVSISALCYALYVVLTKMTVTRRSYSELPLITAIFTWSLPLFLVSSLKSTYAGASGVAYLAIVYLAIFCSIIPFILWTAAIKYLSALTSAVVLLAELVFGVLIAAHFLKESLPLQVIAGCVLVCGGIVMVGSKH